MSEIKNMHSQKTLLKTLANSLMGIAVLTSALPASAGTNQPSQLPLFTSKSVPPLNMLVLGRDHKLFSPAYNDASDLNNDGILDIRYNPAINYFGYFDSLKCYTYASGLFTPTSTTTDKKCRTAGGRWSGDFLNYVTTSRVDALRKVLYGGYRSTDGDQTDKTILERAYIPQDAHSWGKEYKSIAIDGYDIADYTKYSAPTGANYILFANTTPSESGDTSITNWRNPNGAPLMRVYNNVPNRIWEWVAKGAPVAGKVGSVAPEDFIVRNEVCKANLLEDNCKGYSAGSQKPTGLLHDYGESSQMYFGLMSGSYESNRQGGVLRKAVSEFNDEIVANTGQFTSPKKGLIATLDGLKIQDFGPTGAPGTYNHNHNCVTGWGGPATIVNGSCRAWGNPLGEIMYETLRYFSGALAATPNYTYEDSGSDDKLLGMPLITTWQAPYRSTESGGYPACSKPFQTVISDINPSFDSQLPGSPFTGALPDGTPPTVMEGLNVSTLGQTMWNKEFSGTKSIYIGAVGSNEDGAPTAKDVSSFGNIRGLSPEAPTQEGTYYSAMIAYFGNSTDISGESALKRNIKTFAVALSSPLPRLEIPINGKIISLVPFAKVVKGPSGVIASWQPTSQIVAFFVQSLNNMPGQTANASINGGRPQAIFRINYEDAEQGNDYDMDEIVLYTLTVNADNTLSVTLKVEFASAGHESHMGYVISGTTADGIYLDVTGGGSGNTAFKLDTPGSTTANGCNNNTLNGSCGSTYRLPGRLNPAIAAGGDTSPARIFTPGAAPALNLQNPMWFAAKYGGFKDENANNLPDSGEWDSKVAGTPDNYFLVTNALTLKAQLDAAFKEIGQSNNSVTSPAVTPSSSSTDGVSRTIYRTDYQTKTWSGDLIKETVNTTTSGATTVWKASEQLPGSRTIYMADTAGTSLTTFNWSNLASREYTGIKLQHALATDPNDTSAVITKGDGTLKSTAITAGKKRLKFIIGSDTTYRTRTTLIGDIINSSPVIVEGAQYLAYLADTIDGADKYAAFKTAQSTRQAMIYVGANDGMLHAFNATTGAEAFAFIPTAVIKNLNKYTASDYNEEGNQHQFYVDGSPVVRDVYFNDAWRTVLVGTLRAGGRSLFALDITNPASPDLLWEFSEDSTGSKDATTGLSDLGYSFPSPTIARLHSGQWAVLMGNGYDSQSDRAALFMLNVENGNLIKKIPVTAPANPAANGLSSVRAADNNSDGIADYVYAGDLLGNMWRFDLVDNSHATPLKPGGNISTDNFKVSFSGNPLYTAKDSTTSPNPSGNPQPITAPPSLVRHPTLTGYLILFGTGQYFTSADKLIASTSKAQTIYGIWDKQTKGEAASTTPTLTRDNLQLQTITSQVNGATFENSTGNKKEDIRLMSSTAVTWDRTHIIDAEGNAGSAGKYGWYLNLQVDSNIKGERVIDDMAARGNVLFVNTRVPATDPCSAGLEGWSYGINPFTGGKTSFNVFDFNRNGVVDKNDGYGTSKDQVASGYKTPAGGTTISGNDKFNTDGSVTKTNFGESLMGRQSWHVIP